MQTFPLENHSKIEAFIKEQKEETHDQKLVDMKKRERIIDCELDEYIKARNTPKSFKEKFWNIWRFLTGIYKIPKI